MSEQGRWVPVTDGEYDDNGDDRLLISQSTIGIRFDNGQDWSFGELPNEMKVCRWQPGEPGQQAQLPVPNEVREAIRQIKYEHEQGELVSWRDIKTLTTWLDLQSSEQAQLPDTAMTRERRDALAYVLSCANILAKENGLTAGQYHRDVVHKWLQDAQPSEQEAKQPPTE